MVVPDPNIEHETKKKYRHCAVRQTILEKATIQLSLLSFNILKTLRLIKVF